MTASQGRDRSLVFFALLAIWIGIELLTSSRWLAIRSILQQPVAKGPAPGSLAQLLQRSGHAPLPRVWFAPYTSYPEPGLVESRFRSGVYDTFAAFPPSGIASNYGAIKLGPADLLFVQASSQGLQAEAQLARDLGYQFFAVDLGALDLGSPDGGSLVSGSLISGSFNSVAKVLALCKPVNSCQLSKDGYALFRLNQASAAWIGDLDSVRRRSKDFPQRAAGFRWAGVVFNPSQWFVPEGSDLVIRRGLRPQGLMPQALRPLVRIWASPLQSNQLYLYGDRDLSSPLASRLQTRQRRLWLTLAPGVGGADLCMQAVGERPCRPVQLRRHQPRIEITQLLATGKVSAILSMALFGAQGQAMRLDQLPVLPGSSRQQAIYGLEIE